MARRIRPLPTAPLVALFRGQTGADERSNTTPRGELVKALVREGVATESHAYLYLRRGWVDERMADRWAIALGLHPVLVWGDAWESIGATA